jgi:hypothetical protein
MALRGNPTLSDRTGYWLWQHRGRFKDENDALKAVADFFDPKLAQAPPYWLQDQIRKYAFGD